MEEFYLVNGKILDVRTGKFIKADLKKESILYPDSPIFHVQNNLPVRETFTEATAYIIHSDDCLQIPKDNQNILWIILPNGTDDTEIPD